MLHSAVIHEGYEFTKHNSTLVAMCYNRHQNTFVSVDESCMRLWHAHSNSQVRVVNLPLRTSRFIQAITYIESRQIFVASALDGAFRLYDPNLNELAALFTGRATILTMVFDGIHNRLLTGGVDGCGAWQIKARTPGMSEGAFNAQYEFKPLLEFFHGAAAHNSYGRHKLPSNKQLKSSRKSMERSAWVGSLQLSNTRLYAQNRHWIDVYNTNDGTLLERWEDLLPADHGTLTAFVVQECAKYLVCGTSSGAIVVLSLHPISIAHVFKNHTQTITSLREHAASRLLLSSSLDGSVRLWDLEVLRQAHRLSVGHGVRALQLLPVATASQATDSSRATEIEPTGRFYCQLRSMVKLYDIHSILKEHRACHAPVTILQRVVFPTTRPRLYQLSTKLAVESVQGELVEESEDKSFDSDEDSDEDNEAASTCIAVETQQRILVVCMDKTLCVFTGRTQNEVPSFTWIADEKTMDLVALALHPVTQQLFLLLSSQKLLLVNTAPRSQRPSSAGKANASEAIEVDANHEVGATADSVERVIDLHSSASEVFPDESGNSNAAIDTSNLARVSNSNRPSLCCICVCPFPPVFPPDWHCRRAARTSSARRRRQPTCPSVGPLVPSLPPPRRRNALVQSKWEWIVCGSNFGRLLFWHTGLREGRNEELSIDAHDAPIVEVNASAFSPLLVSLDDAGHVHVWSLQPQFALCHVLQLGLTVSVFVLSPLSEMLLSGYDDGRVALYAVSCHAESVEAFTGVDNHHSTTVNAGDFLDEKHLVVTASLDAIVKVWNQQRVLLRQVSLATAVTSLCFLNANGDLLAGLSSGTFFISRRDVLPAKTPKPAPPRRHVKDHSQATKAQAVVQPAELTTCTVVDLKRGPVRESSPTTGDSVSIDAASLAPQRIVLAADLDSSAKELLTHVIQRPVDAATHLQPPVLRSLGTFGNNSPSLNQLSSHRNTLERQIPLLIPALTCPKAVNDPTTDYQEEDWRDKILPLSPYQKVLRASLSYKGKKGGLTSSSPVVLRTLGPTTQSLYRDNTKCSKSGDRLDSAEAPLARGLGLSSVAAPLVYCKHQAPVPPKDKTPRKLWNAIGGEDRRLIVLQRNRLSPY